LVFVEEMDEKKDEALNHWMNGRRLADAA